MLNYIIKISVALTGLCILAFGVAISVKADLGVSPISCIPYIYSLKLSLTIGQLTIIMNGVFVAAQMLILGRKYSFLHLGQLLAVFFFGICIDGSMLLVSDLTAQAYYLKLLLCLGSCVLIAFGIFLLVTANITYLPADGLAAVIAENFKIEFGRIKVTFDSSMVIIGLISSFAFFMKIIGIREGTIVAALLVGSLVKFYTSRLKFINKLPGLERTNE